MEDTHTFYFESGEENSEWGNTFHILLESFVPCALYPIHWCRKYFSGLCARRCLKVWPSFFTLCQIQIRTPSGFAVPEIAYFRTRVKLHLKLSSLTFFSLHTAFISPVHVLQLCTLSILSPETKPCFHTSPVLIIFLSIKTQNRERLCMPWFKPLFRDVNNIRGFDKHIRGALSADWHAIRWE